MKNMLIKSGTGVSFRKREGFVSFTLQLCENRTPPFSCERLFAKIEILEWSERNENS